MQEAFDKLNESITSLPVLVYANYDKEFIVSIDASIRSVGAVLSQFDEDGREYPIHYANRTLNDAEKNYSTYERESLEMVFALKKFRHYLFCQKLML